MTSEFLNEAYDEYPRIEDEFQAALDESLQPRGPDLLYDIVRELRLPPGAGVIDLGCGEGDHSFRLAETFGFAVQGVDPVRRNIELGNEALEEAAKQNAELRRLVRFALGTAEAMPVDDASVDLIWCRESLYFFDLENAFAECRRVLRTDGRMLIYNNFETELMEPPEAERWHAPNPGTMPANSDPRNVEAAFADVGFTIEQDITLGSEFGEYGQEHTGKPGQQLIHAARLMRAPERYIARFGETNYDIMLADALWHVYRMIGKLSSRIYLLKKP
jgi:SAM-dependent methyltransferase